MQHNLLTDSMVTVSGRSGRKKALSLPELFAAMARQEVAGFLALRPHQRPAWHMFLVQLAALALWKAGKDCPEEDGETWAVLLRKWTEEFEHDDPWCLVVENPNRPAFLQPPRASGLRWKPVPTPDNLDLLNSSKNFDVKHAVAHANAPEDWLYALVSVQTMAGYSGQGNQGIARMSSGLSSRPLLGLAPGSALDRTVDASAWWARDVRRLLQGRRASDTGTVGGPALLWCLPWPEDEQLQIADLDPWFIEVCRRVRIEQKGGCLSARRGGSKKPRINGKPFRGNVGDPWIPVEKKKNGKSLTLGRAGFAYDRLTELVFSDDWRRPFLARYGREETGEMVLVASAFARGRHKSEGFHTRRVPVPGRELYESPVAAECAVQLVEEIRTFAVILRNALAVVAAGGDFRRIDSSHYDYTRLAHRRFDRRADRLFFRALWQRAAAHEDGATAIDRARKAFLEALLHATRAVFEIELPVLPCPSVLRPRAEARARKSFRHAVRERFPALSGVEPKYENAPMAGACEAAAFLQQLGAVELLALRRQPIGTGASAFHLLAARHPNTIGGKERETEWSAIVRTLAILTPVCDPAQRPPLHDPQRRFGTVLWDGGNVGGLQSEGRGARPLVSEARFLRLLAARGPQRASELEWAARVLSARMTPGSGVDVHDIAAVLLTPEDRRRIAGPYYRCMDRAQAQYASDYGKGATL